MSHETEAAVSSLEQSGHALAQPLQAIINTQELLRVGQAEQRESMSQQVAKLDKLERAVLGDEQYFQQGILPTLNNHEKRIRSLENWRTYVLAVGFTLAIIWNVVKPFLPKIP